MNVLDNAVWHSIDGPLHHLADRVGLAGRFHRDVAPFAAVCDDPPPSAWDDLAKVIGPGHRAMLFAPDVSIPDEWAVDFTIPAVQLVAENVVEERTDLELFDLTPTDVPEMLALVSDTRPGPFEQRTIELGRYLGHRIDGRLVAMAGERMRCPGFTEVSAVCTAEDQRGRGLGAALTLAVVDHIRSGGDEAFLHAAADNSTAINLYLKLGFALRRELVVSIVRENR
jgi:ribosomal protein S18 acetylase RimI-like enzyme